MGADPQLVRVRLPDGVHELSDKDAVTAAAGILKEFHPSVTFASLDELRKAGMRLFGLVKDNELLSVATVAYQLHVSEGRRAWVEDLLTKPERRSEGHGAELLKEIISRLHSEGISKVMVQTREANIGSHRFYKKEGGHQGARVYSWRRNE